MNETKNFSRRDFFKLAGLSLASMALGPHVSADQHTPKQKFAPPKESDVSPEKKNFIGETITVGNLELTPLITEHDKKAWESDGQAILTELQKYQTIIPEYFPPDYEPHLKENPLINYVADQFYGEPNYLFIKLAEHFRQENKTITIVDPAYSDAFIKLRATQNWWVASIGAIGALFPAARALDRARSFDSSTRLQTLKSLTRVAFSSGTALGALGGGGFSTFADMDVMSVEKDLRHVFIAQALVQLGNQEEAPKQAAIIYPAGHWYGENNSQGSGKIPTKGILHYLKNPEERMSQFEYYNKKFFGKETWEDFYKIRNYAVENGSWQQDHVVDLEVK